MSTAGMLGVRLTGEAWWCMFNTLWAETPPEDSTKCVIVFEASQITVQICSEIIYMGRFNNEALISCLIYLLAHTLQRLLR